MRELSLILRVYFIAWRNTTIGKGPVGYFKLALIALLYLCIGGGASYGGYALSSSLSHALLEFPDLAQVVFTNILMSIGLSTTVLILFSVPNQAYSQIYDSSDMAFLMSTPLIMRHIFITKFIGTYIFALSVAPLTLGPILGIGISLKAGFAYYLTAVVGFLALTAVVTSLAVLLIMLIMRYVPGQRLKQIFIGMGLMLGLCISFLSQAISYKIMGVSGNGNGTKALADTIAQLNLGDIPLFPHAWFAKSLSGYLPLADSAVTSVVPLVLLIGVAVVLTYLVILLSERVYLAGWASNQEVDRKTSTKRRNNRETHNSERRLLPSSPFWGCVVKEFRLIKREPLLWYNFAVSLVVITFLVANNLREMGKNAQGAAEMPGKMEFLFFTIVLFVCSASSGLFATTCLSREGGAWEFLRACPLKPSVVIRAKLLVAAAPQLVATWLSIIVVSLLPSIPFPSIVFSLTASTLIILTLSLIMTLTDVFYPNFDFKLSASSGGKQKAGGIKVTVASLMQLVLLAIMVATLFFPSYSPLIRLFSDWKPAFSMTAAYGLFALETVGLALWAFATASRRLEKMMTGSI